MPNCDNKKEPEMEHFKQKNTHGIRCHGSEYQSYLSSIRLSETSRFRFFSPHDYLASCSIHRKHGDALWVLQTTLHKSQPLQRGSMTMAFVVFSSIMMVSASGQYMIHSRHPLSAIHLSLSTHAMLYTQKFSPPVND